MQPYIELNAHHIGKSHVQKGLSCEDYSAVYSDEQISIVTISDGHGDRNCFRSAKGARYACETAISACRKFHGFVNQIVDITQCDFESLVVSLESDIVEMWRDKVLSDASAHPFQEEELAIASEQAQEVYRSGQRLEKAYGCTLIIAMSTEYYWLALQIGDGKCVAAYSDGVFVEPIPVDENCLGNRSTSLCNSSAKESFRHYYSRTKPIATFVFSDGVEESFDQTGLFNCLYSVAFWLKEEGLDTAQAKVEALLPQVSDGGSGDDVSIATMVSTIETIAKPRQTLLQIYERVNACENALEQCTAHLANTKDRLIEKEKECSATIEEIARMKAELEKNEKLLEAILSDKKTLESSIDELDARAKRASEQMEKATKYKISAERYWFAELEKLGIREFPIEDNDINDASAADVYIAECEQLIEEETLVSGKIVQNDDGVQGSAQTPEDSNTEIYSAEDVCSDGYPMKNQYEETSGDMENEQPVRRFWPFSKQPK